MSLNKIAIRRINRNTETLVFVVIAAAVVTKGK